MHLQGATKSGQCRVYFAELKVKAIIRSVDDMQAGIRAKGKQNIWARWLLP